MKKNVFTFALALLTAGSAWALEFQSEDFSYKVISSSAKTVEITDYLGYSTELTIPHAVTYNDVTYSVVSIGSEAFKQSAFLMTVSIPNSIKTIGTSAFSGCSSLTAINIPNSVTSIQASTFSDCSSLASINIPTPVTSIGDKAFYGCYSMTEVTIGNRVASIGTSAFEGCFSLTQITIPNSVTSIGSSAFEGCDALTQVNIGSSVTSIGESAFNGCSALTQVTIGNSVKSIGDGAFANCYALAEMNVLPTVPPAITANTFYNINPQVKVSVPEDSRDAYMADENWKQLLDLSARELSGTCGDNLTWTFTTADSTLTISGTGDMYDYDYSDQPWYNSRQGIKNISLPDGMTSIGGYAFSGCSALVQVTIPESVTSIGGSAFSNCSALTQVTIGNSVTSIDNAFYNCSKLRQVTWNAINCADFKSRNDSPFSYTQITTFIFGEQVEHIPAYLCYGMSKLTEIIVLATVAPTVGMATFSNVSREIPVYVPAGALFNYWLANDWEEFDLRVNQTFSEPATDGAGVYQISNAEELYWFAGLVNGTLKDGTEQNRAAKAVLTADILLNDTTGWQEWNQDTELPNIWTPIGYNTYNNDNSFTGSLDGQGHTISGIFVYYRNNSSYEKCGLFGCIGTGGTVKNLGITASYIYSYTAGGIAGNNQGTISYCYNSGIVYGYHMNNEYRRSYDGGGIAGINDSGTIIYCYNTGNITSGGGIAGYNENGGAILHCHSVGTSGYGITGYNESNCTVTNCYYMAGNASNGIGNVSTDQNGQTESRTAWQFSTGEVCWLLNGEYAEGAWRQTLDKDPYPVLKGPKVVKVGNDYQNDYSALERTNATAFRAWKSNGEVFVEHTQDMTGVALYDVNGRLLHQTETNGYGVLRMAAPGKIHIVRATYADGTTASQKVM